MEINSIIKSISKVDDPNKLSVKKVTELFGDCVLKETDFDEDGLTCDFLIGEGVTGKAIFSIPRLNEHRDELDMCISQLHDIDKAPSFNEFYYDEDGNKWTEETLVVDMLVQMGMASSMLFYTFPDQLWPYLPDGKPFIGKKIYTAKKGISGFEAKLYTKMFNEK